MRDCPRCKEQPEVYQDTVMGWMTALCNGCYDGGDTGPQMYVSSDDKRDLALQWNDLVTYTEQGLK